MIQANVIAMSGRAVEAAGDVDVLLLDKTGTITLGNRQATALHPGRRRDARRARRRGAARLARRRDARGPQHRRAGQGEVPASASATIEKLGATFVPFTAQTRMSGVDLDGRQIRKGAADAIEAYVKQLGGTLSRRRAAARSTTIAKAGARRWWSPTGAAGARA